MARGGRGSFSVSTKVYGADALLYLLNRVPYGAANRANRAAIRAGCYVVRRAIVQYIPVEYGLLKAAQDVKVQTRNGASTGFVGSDVEKLKKYEAYPKSPGRGIVKLYRPTNIDWLANYGHIAGATDTFVLQGLIPAGTFIPGAHYMEQAAATSQNAASATVERVLTQQTMKELFRAGAAGKLKP